jgi:uncharacterized protein YraI
MSIVTWLLVSSLFTLASDYYVTTSDLNLRTGPGKEYSVSYTLSKGSEVEIISKESNWYKITYSGNTGYVHSKFLKFSRTITDSGSPQTEQQTVPYLIIGLSIIVIVFVIAAIYGKLGHQKILRSVTERKRGTSTERDLVLKLLNHGIPAQSIFHDLYVQNDKGGFSQIDLVVTTEVGIIVFEVKAYSGWLFGSGNHSEWTQVLAYGKRKYRFYNPIMQNNKHMAELRKKFMTFRNIPLYSVVVFYGDCVLKEINYVPNGTFLTKSGRALEVVNTILKDNKPVHYAQIEVAAILREAVANGGIIENKIQHKESIKDMLGKHRIFE